MLVRVYVYCHLAAVLLTAPAQYWDGVNSKLFNLSLAAIYVLPLLLVTLLFILFSSKVDGRNKRFALMVVMWAILAQIVAAIPLIQ